MKRRGLAFTAVFAILFLSASLFAAGVACADEAKGDSRKKGWGAEIILMEKGGILLPKGQLVLEPGVQYSHTSRTRISISGFTIFEAIVIGKIISEDIKRDILTVFANVRYGLTDNLQFDVKIPWLYRHDRETFVIGPSGTDTAERTVTGSDIGDIEIGLNWQVARERGARPDIVLNLRGKTTTGKDPYGLSTEQVAGTTRFTEFPTGSGHYGLSAGVTLVKSSDPAILYLTSGYFYNFKRNIGTEGGVDYGEIKPGDSLEFSLGMSYALNEKLSTSISYQQRFTFSAKQNGVDIPDSSATVGTVFFGISNILSDKSAVSFSLGVGLTNDAPDMTVELRFPFNI